MVDPLHPVSPFVSIAAKWLHAQTIDGYEISYDILYAEVEKTIPIYQGLIRKYPENAEYLLYLGSTYGIRARVALATKNWLQVIYSSKQIITPECGILHLAAACKIPVTIIYDSNYYPEAMYKEYHPWKYKHTKLVSNDTKLNEKILNNLI